MPRQSTSKNVGKTMNIVRLRWQDVGKNVGILGQRAGKHVGGQARGSKIWNA